MLNTIKTSHFKTYYNKHNKCSMNRLLKLLNFNNFLKTQFLLSLYLKSSELQPSALYWSIHRFVWRWFFFFFNTTHPCTYTEGLLEKGAGIAGIWYYQIRQLDHLSALFLRLLFQFCLIISEERNKRRKWLCYILFGTLLPTKIRTYLVLQPFHGQHNVAIIVFNWRQGFWRVHRIRLSLWALHCAIHRHRWCGRICF